MCVYESVNTILYWNNPKAAMLVSSNRWATLNPVKRWLGKWLCTPRSVNVVSEDWGNSWWGLVDVLFFCSIHHFSGRWRCFITSDPLCEDKHLFVPTRHLIHHFCPLDFMHSEMKIIYFFKASSSPFPSYWYMGSWPPVQEGWGLYCVCVCVRVHLRSKDPAGSWWWVFLTW